MFLWNSVKFQKLSFIEMHLNISSVKCQPFFQASTGMPKITSLRKICIRETWMNIDYVLKCYFLWIIKIDFCHPLLFWQSWYHPFITYTIINFDPFSCTYNSVCHQGGHYWDSYPGHNFGLWLRTCLATLLAKTTLRQFWDHKHYLFSVNVLDSILTQIILRV